MSDVAGQSRGLRLLIILLIGLPCMDLCMYLMLQARVIKSEEFLVGLLIGQFAFTGVLAGGTGRAWNKNLLLACLLASSVPVSMVLWSNWRQGTRDLDTVLLVLGSTPPLVFCGSLPFLFVRAISGYRLMQQPGTIGRSINMEDFFLTTGVCAAMLVPVPAAFSVVNEGSENVVTIMSVIGVVVFAVALLIVLPATMTYFVLKRFAVRLLVLAGVCIGIPFFIVWLLSLSGLLRLSGTTFLEEFAPTLATAAGCFAMCLVVLRAAGYSWRRDEKAVPAAAIDPLRDEEVIVGPRGEKWENRVAALFIVFASAGFVTWCKGLENQRKVLSDRVSAIEAEWLAQAGRVNRYRFTVYSFTAPPSARLEDIEFLLQSQELNLIELAGTEINDATLTKISNLDRLQTINLSRTKIGDSGLRALNAAKNLTSINLAFTQVTAAGLKDFLAERKGHSLNLSGLGLTDEDFLTLPLSLFSYFNLSHNPLTVTALSKVRHAHTLDLSHTRIDGSGLPQLDASELVLDYVSITDSQLQALTETSPRLSRLSIRGTQISDASLPVLAGITNLSIGDSQITQAGLSASRLTTKGRLALHDKRFDGSLFASRKWTIDHLDLRQSSISDRDIGSLANVQALSILNLHSCDVSDASLPFLATLALNSIDLTDTHVTGEAAWQYLQHVAVCISASQCSDAVRTKIRDGSTWRVGNTLEEPLD